MRFAAAHKAVSYLMVLAGFSVLALSGELSLPWLVGTALLGATSYIVGPRRPPWLDSAPWSWAWNGLTLTVFAASLLAALRGEAVILVGAHFLCFLLVNKLWNLRAAKDWQQAYVVSFLMLLAGTTLNTDLVYAGSFIAYVVFATWSLTLFHLRREMEENYLLKHSDRALSERVEVERILNSRRVVGGAFLAVTSLVSVGVFVGSLAVFFLFPRVGFGVFLQQSRGGMRVGFSDSGVELGQNGLIKENEQVVMRVEFPGGRPPQPLYFRGIAFERYTRADGGRSAGWQMAAERARGRLQRVDGSWVPAGLGLDKVTLRGRRAGAVAQEIYLEPMGEATALFAAGVPLGYRFPPGPAGLFTTVPEGDLIGDVFLPGRQSGIRYTAWSDLSPPAAAQLARQPDLAPERVDELRESLQLPADLPPRIIELARTLTRDVRGPWRKARAIMAWLAANQRYTTLLERDYRYDPLEDFLFVHRAGHCEYFATALAILLRASGVPTRHVAGFYGGEWNSYGNYLQVRQRDAHAWVEVLMGDLGWVALDGTPAGEGGGGAEGGLGQRLRQLVDVLQMAWFKYVIEYDLGKQIDFLQGVRGWFADRPTSSARSPWDWIQSHRRRLALISTLVVAGAWLVRRRRAPPGMPRRRVADHRVSSAFVRAVRALERRGISRRSGETPRELASRVTLGGDPGAAPFGELVELYYATRFGGAELDEARLARLVDAVARPPLRRDPS